MGSANPHDPSGITTETKYTSRRCAPGVYEVESTYQFPLTLMNGVSEYVEFVFVIAFFHSASKVCRVVKSAAGSVFVTHSV